MTTNDNLRGLLKDLRTCTQLTSVPIKWGFAAENGMSGLDEVHAWMRNVYDRIDAALAEPDSPHTTQDDYEHFLSYSGLRDEPRLRYAYFHGADADCEKPDSGEVVLDRSAMRAAMRTAAPMVPGDILDHALFAALAESELAEVRADRDQQYDMKVKAREQRDSFTTELEELRAELERVKQASRRMLEILDHPTRSVSILDADALRAAIDASRDGEYPL